MIDENLCSTCSQCVALCPERALIWCGTPPSARKPERLPNPAQLDELFKQRRSVRVFARDKIARPILEELAAYAAYAPTNNYDFRLVIVDDPRVLQALEAYARSMVSGLYRVIFKHRFLFELGPSPRLAMVANRG